MYHKACNLCGATIREYTCPVPLSEQLPGDQEIRACMQAPLRVETALYRRPELRNANNSF